MDKSMKQLLKEAHDHGYNIGRSMLTWDAQKSFVQFLKENNFPLLTEDEVRDQAAEKAIHLRGQGHSFRNVASVLGYNHPQSIVNLIKWYNKRLRKRKKLNKQSKEEQQ